MKNLRDPNAARGRFPHACAALLAALTLAQASAAPAAAPIDLPPLWESGDGEQHVGKIIWHELATPDLEAAKAFYGALFGWTFRDVDAAAAPGDGAAPRPARYTIAVQDGQFVAGIVRRSAPATPAVQPAWLSFFCVEDVDAARRSAEAHGAKVLVEPRSYGRRGRQAILADPQGAVFAILASHTGAAPDVLAAPGQWIWGSLLVRDADKDAAFYQDLFGYEVYEMPSPDGREHVVLANDDLARASVNDMPDDSPRRHPHWLGLVRVIDVAAAAARVRTLGGRVLVEPHEDRHGGQLAVVADPQGAVLGLMDWADLMTPGGAQ
jgi:predicted enzyme related to lactoylglutathione lyase